MSLKKLMNMYCRNLLTRSFLVDGKKELEENSSSCFTN